MREGWIYKKLGEVCVVLDSMRKPVTKKDRKEGNYPYYGATGIQDYVDSYLFDGRYLLVGEDGAKWGPNEGTAFIIEGKSWVNNHAHIIQLNKDVNDILVKYYLNFKDLSDYITGAVVPKLTQQALKNIQIPIPPLTTQQQIVSELDLLSHILDQKRQQLKEYDALAESIFYDMFGDPVENPKGWEVKMWGDLFETKLGKMLDKNKQRSQDRKLPYLANVNVQWGYFDLTNLKTMTFSQEEESKFEILNGDLLLCEGGEAGRCAIWKYGTTEIKYQKAVHRARPKFKNVEVVYISHFIQKLRERGGLKDYLTKATIEHLTGEKLKKLPIPLPPLSLQRSFAAKIESIEHQKQLLRASIKETEMLFQSRMDYWFNG